MDKNTIILGELNAKHTISGSTCNNDRGVDILQMMDEKELMILNDGTPTDSSFSDNTCRSSDLGDQMLAKPFSSQEFLLALACLGLKKSLEPDGLHVQMLKVLDIREKQRLRDIINMS
ncbi:hypothetical protein TNIN_176731 [Trichonephila inaurata madagascariensis]|uniref:Endonuclease/exonuclease/phosphatase domain-containing protein n=1 Tax=Trichonephila inaurata madagascariensis TaxID=2747483 RepID=A0A8X6XZX2_9ARAC|nr:hypothetical protein TNIN_176731 [Trichonephila inaurata madagascariensis]